MSLFVLQTVPTMHVLYMYTICVETHSKGKQPPGLVAYRRVMLFCIWIVAFPVGCVAYGYNNFCKFNDGCVNGGMSCAGRMSFSFCVILLAVASYFNFRLIVHALWKKEKRPKMSHDTLNSSVKSASSPLIHETESDSIRDTRRNLYTDMSPVALNNIVDDHLQSTRENETARKPQIFSEKKAVGKKSTVLEEDNTDHLVWLQIVKLFKILFLFQTAAMYVIGVNIRYCHRWVGEVEYLSPPCKAGFLTILTANPSNWISFVWLAGLLLVLPARQRQDNHQTLRAIQTRILENI